jgi:imidazolonepropionase-like amidohydrolase
MATTTGSDGGLLRRWLAGGRVVDVLSGAVSGPSSIAVESGRITSIRPGPPPVDSSDVVDLDGLYLLPGIITCHVHLQGTYPYSTRDPHEPPPRTALRAAARARAIRRHGITTVRCCHELNQADVHVRHAAQMGWTDAPRIVAGGRGLTRPGGHGDGFGAVVAEGREGFYDAAARELEAGASHIKIYASGGLARQGEALEEPELTFGEMRGAVEAAAAHGSYVVAHAAGSATVRVGLEAGVRSFEHAYLLDAATASAMANSGVFLTPTLVATHAIDWMRSTGFSNDAISRSAAMAEEHTRSARRAIEAGVTITHGTDLPPDGVSNGTTLAVRELELLVEAGASVLTALQSATVSAARLVGLQGEIGELREGTLADLIATADDPTQSVGALRAIRFIMHGGASVRAGGAASPPGSNPELRGSESHACN